MHLVLVLRHWRFGLAGSGDEQRGAPQSNGWAGAGAGRLPHTGSAAQDIIIGPLHWHHMQVFFNSSTEVNMIIISMFAQVVIHYTVLGKKRLSLSRKRLHQRKALTVDFGSGRQLLQMLSPADGEEDATISIADTGNRKLSGTREGGEYYTTAAVT